MLYRQRGAFDDAIRMCDAGLAKPSLDKTSEVLLRFNRGAAYLGSGQFESALQDFDSVSADMDERLKQMLELSVNAHHALALYGLGREAEARDLWNELAVRESRYRDMAWIKEQFKWPESLLNLAQRLMS